MKKLFSLLFVFVLFLGNSAANAKTEKIIESQNLSITATPSKTALKPIDSLVGNYDNKVKIMFSDIDHTVLDVNSESMDIQPSEKLVLAVKKLNKAKIPLIFETGRSYADSKDVVKKIGNENSYLVTQQGAEVHDSKGNLVFQFPMDYNQSITMLDRIELVKKQNKLDSKVYVFVGSKAYSLSDYKIKVLRDAPIVIKSYKELDKKMPICRILVYEINTDKLKIIQADLKKVFPDYTIDLGTSFFCEINAPGVSKGAIAKKLAQMLNIDLKNAATIGDSENDISMTKEVRKAGGLTICVGNAMPKLKEQAEYITAPVSEDGFAKAVDKILENNEVLKQNYFQNIIRK